MSFDIDFRTCNFGNRKMQRQNPFTLQMVEVTVHDGLTGSERAAVRKLLAADGAPEPDSFGRDVVAFSDGAPGGVSPRMERRLSPVPGSAVPPRAPPESDAPAG